MKTVDVKEQYNDYVLGTYPLFDLCIVKGKGSRVWDVHGDEYLDLFPGWAVSGLGHCHPKVMSAVRDQIGKIFHVPNVYMIPKQAALARVIAENAFPSKSFFCNSGSEANESAIKFIRKWGNPKGKFEIITMKQSFHGRTLASLTATGQEKFHEGFEPLPGGFKYATFNDFASVESLVTDKTAAILFEPVQGEGGIQIADDDFMKKIRALCDEKEILLALDEVQTGMGRTGKMFAYQHYGIEPDLMMLAKSLGNGLPIGALVVNNRLENVLVPGTHATTYGGNPIVCAGALAVFKAIKEEKILEHVSKMSEYLLAGFQKLKDEYSQIKEIRHLGLMFGIELSCDGTEYLTKAREKKLLINCTQGNILRIVPANNVTKKEADQGLQILKEVFEELS